MSANDGRELRIVGFLCNWCSYGGADTAGVSRLNQPTDLDHSLALHRPDGPAFHVQGPALRC